MRRVSEVAAGVQVTTSRRYSTTTTVIISSREALVVDPAWDADELAGVADVLTAADARCTAGVATHLHYDHVLWHPNLGNVPRWATPWTVEQWEADRERLIAPLIGDLPSTLLEMVGRLQPLTESDVPWPTSGGPLPDQRPATDASTPYLLPWPGRDVVVHEHDAHARGHLALEIVDAQVVIVGDMLSDIELPYPDPDEPDLATYLTGLDRLAEVVRRAKVLIPGHGTPTTTPMTRLDADRRYLEAVLAGRDPHDRRVGNPDMAAVHQRTLEQARGAADAHNSHQDGKQPAQTQRPTCDVPTRPPSSA